MRTRAISGREDTIFTRDEERREKEKIETEREKGQERGRKEKLKGRTTKGHPEL